MAVAVLRTITLTYPDWETYVDDREHWHLPDAGKGVFGTHKAWSQSISAYQHNNGGVQEEQ